MTGIEQFDVALPHGITLACRAAGQPGRPVLVFLHGFPQAAFVWDAMLLHCIVNSKNTDMTFILGMVKMCFIPSGFSYSGNLFLLNLS